MTVLVCGGRDFDDDERLFRLLDAVHKLWPIDRVVHGDAKGADTAGGQWARDRHIGIAVYPAQWDIYGKMAGPIRNQQMLDREVINLVVAAPGGRGTADMIIRARAAKVPVVRMETR